MEQNNKLIAEFMGYEVKHNKCYSPKYNDGTIAPMQFHTSWDWLMPVVQKCIRTGDNTDEWDNIFDALSLLSINAVYEEVVEFIKGYEVMDIHSQYSFYLERCVDEDEGEIALSFEEWKQLNN